MPSAGDRRELFEELATPLFRPLFNFARWLTRDTAEAEDLVQEAYAKALKGFGSFQEGTNFRAWIFRILRNTFLSSRASQHPERYVAFEEEDEQMIMPKTTETPESILLRSTTRRQIEAALERMPATYREVILLCDVEEMKYQEISETLGIPLGTVMSRVSRARKLLRGLLVEEQMGIR